MVYDRHFALAKWERKQRTKTKEFYMGWTEYMWPSSMESCIRWLVQEFVARSNLVVSMKEFKEKWDEYLQLIYKKIDEERRT